MHRMLWFALMIVQFYFPERVLCAEAKRKHEIPATALVSESLPKALRMRLNKERVRIETWRTKLRTKVKLYNSQCDQWLTPDTASECKDSAQKLKEEKKTFISAVIDFNRKAGGSDPEKIPKVH